MTIQLFQLFGSHVPEIRSEMIPLLKSSLENPENVLLRLQCFFKLLPPFIKPLAGSISPSFLLLAFSEKFQYGFFFFQ